MTLKLRLFHFERVISVNRSKPVKGRRQHLAEVSGGPSVAPPQAVNAGVAHLLGRIAAEKGGELPYKLKAKCENGRVLLQVIGRRLMLEPGAAAELGAQLIDSAWVALGYDRPPPETLRRQARP